MENTIEEKLSRGLISNLMPDVSSNFCWQLGSGLTSIMLNSGIIFLIKQLSCPSFYFTVCESQGKPLDLEVMSKQFFCCCCYNTYYFLYNNISNLLTFCIQYPSTKMPWMEVFYLFWKKIGIFFDHKFKNCWVLKTTS